MGQQKVPKPKAILFDLCGTATKTTFIDKVLLPYINDNIKSYLEEKWTDKDVVTDVERLRAQSAKDETLPKIAGKDAEQAEQIQSISDHVLFCMVAKKESRAISMFRFHMWFDGYDKDRIVTPVYSDVAFQLKKWKYDENIKMFVVSNGWVEATKKFMSKTAHGDLGLLIDGYFELSSTPLNLYESFVKILAEIKESPENVLFLTKSAEEAKAAQKAGIKIMLCLTHRRNIEKLDESERKLPKIRTFNELEFE